MRRDAGGLCGRENRLGVGATYEVAGLVLAEQESVRQGASRRNDLKSDRGGQGHLGRRGDETAVRQVMHGADRARSDQLTDEVTVSTLGGKVDRRRRTVLAA